METWTFLRGACHFIFHYFLLFSHRGFACNAGGRDLIMMELNLLDVIKNKGWLNNDFNIIRAGNVCKESR